MQTRALENNERVDQDGAVAVDHPRPVAQRTGEVPPQGAERGSGWLRHWHQTLELRTDGFGGYPAENEVSRGRLGRSLLRRVSDGGPARGPSACTVGPAFESRQGTESREGDDLPQRALWGFGGRWCRSGRLSRARMMRRAERTRVITSTNRPIGPDLTTQRASRRATNTGLGHASSSPADNQGLSVTGETVAIGLMTCRSRSVSPAAG
jgi:hypothetical protein